jgi:hypothetical protein
MDNGQEEGAMLLEELEVVVGGLTRPWTGMWQPVDLAAGVTPATAPDVNAPLPTSAVEP